MIIIQQFMALAICLKEICVLIITSFTANCLFNDMQVFHLKPQQNVTDSKNYSVVLTSSFSAHFYYEQSITSI